MAAFPKQKKTVRIEIEAPEKDDSRKWKPFQKEEKHLKNCKKPNNSADIQVKQNKGNKAGPNSMDINDRVSDYINRAKIRLRSVTMLSGGGGEGKAGRAEQNQGYDGHFTDYIHRMKMKLRTTSMVGTGKDVTDK